ncbi:hypothetical protein LP415_22395 [Polaromonas sp. P1(28)-8]|nr:hypothetical protein LP415_22395 [Polaromonas sp. P1(28)-8]
MCGNTGGLATQNAALTWPNGTRGELIDLLNWAGSRLLLLVFGDLPATAARRLQELAVQTDVRCVQVIPPTAGPAPWST